jgi:hypothetical protein
MRSDFSPSVFYYPYGPKAVLALADAEVDLEIRPPLELEGAQVTRIVAPIDRLEESAGIFHAAMGKSRVRPSAILLLFPTTDKDVDEVKRNWLSALDNQDWLKGPHGWYLGSEVSDDWNTYPNLLGAELALWRAIHRIRPSNQTDYRCHCLEEAIELGDLIMGGFLDGKQKRFGVALEALSDIVRRTMVAHKMRTLEALGSI